MKYRERKTRAERVSERDIKYQKYKYLRRQRAKLERKIKSE